MQGIRQVAAALTVTCRSTHRWCRPRLLAAWASGIILSANRPCRRRSTRAARALSAGLRSEGGWASELEPWRSGRARRRRTGQDDEIAAHHRVLLARGENLAVRALAKAPEQREVAEADVRGRRRPVKVAQLTYQVGVAQATHAGQLAVRVAGAAHAGGGPHARQRPLESVTHTMQQSTAVGETHALPLRPRGRHEGASGGAWVRVRQRRGRAPGSGTAC